MNRIPSPGAPLYKAYVSEPITRCPPREKGRIQTLVQKMTDALALDPFRVELYIPSKVSSPEVRGQMTPQHVYLLDRIRVVESDFMIVIADQTSFGIGGEVEMATALGKPVVILSRDETLSRFLVGSPTNIVHELNPAVHYLHYRDWRDLKSPLQDILQQILPEIGRIKTQVIPTLDVGKRITRLRKRAGMDLQTLAHKAALRTPHLALLETSLEQMLRELETYGDASDLGLTSINLTSHQLDQVANIGLPALHRLATVLDVPIAELISDQTAAPSLKGPSHEIEARRRQTEKTRRESLKARAVQYDITFREYLALETLLVEEALDRASSKKNTRSLLTIGEQEFLNALDQVRRDGLDRR